MGQSIFVYEFITGGGLLAASPAVDPPESLLREGHAMVTALVADLVSPPGSNKVSILWDQRWSLALPAGVEASYVASHAEMVAKLHSQAAAADWTIVIAPEFDGELARYAAEVVRAGGRLLSPAVDWIRLAADKQAMANYLTDRGVPTPQGIAIGPGANWPSDFPTPAVLKPRWGAGSADVRLLHAALSQIPKSGLDAGKDCWRLEEFCPGRAISVAMIGGKAGTLILPPMTQRQSSDNTFTYLGGDWPLPPALRQRSEGLARRLLAALPAWIGYAGCDLVLGAAEDGSQDVVIEVNPRLTTSYVGLRAACQTNLAQVMLKLAAGNSLNDRVEGHRVDKKCQSIAFDAHPLHFCADGLVSRRAMADGEYPSEKSENYIPAIWVSRV